MSQLDEKDLAAMKPGFENTVNHVIDLKKKVREMFPEGLEVMGRGEQPPEDLLAALTGIVLDVDRVINEAMMDLIGAALPSHVDNRFVQVQSESLGTVGLYLVRGDIACKRLAKAARRQDRENAAMDKIDPGRNSLELLMQRIERACND